MEPSQAVGIDVGGTKLLILAGAHRVRVPTGPEADGATLEAAIRAELARLGLRPALIGIAIPGLVDADGRVEMSGVLPRLAGWRPAEALADFGCRVHALNDAEAALVEEAHTLPAGATAGIVMAGTAIGTAFRVEGVPLRGARGWAGELGFMPLATADGVKRLDDLAGGRFIAARLGTDGSGLQQRAQQGDAAALAAIREGGAALGLALAPAGAGRRHDVAARLRRSRARRGGAPRAATAAGELRRAAGGPSVVALGALRAAAQSVR